MNAKIRFSNSWRIIRSRLSFGFFDAGMFFSFELVGSYYKIVFLIVRYQLFFWPMVIKQHAGAK